MAIRWPFRRRKGWSQPPFWSLDQNLQYALPSEKEQLEASFTDYVHRYYKQDGVVWACVLARLLLFAEARFQWRGFEGGRPTELFGNEALGILEEPWPGGTTGELLAHMEQDVSLAGNSYWTAVRDEDGERLRRLRPDWVTIVTGSKSGNPFDLDAKVVGYLYEPRLVRWETKPTLLLPNQVAHYSPYPDPTAQWRGMSWLTPVIREIQADQAATEHKRQFFKRGATLNVVVRLDKDVNTAEFDGFVERFKAQHEGAWNAYRTLFIGGGADVTPVSANFRQLDFKRVQGQGETRIAAAAGVPPIVVGLSEGLEASTYANYGQARRKFADHFARPHWRMAAASLQALLERPAGSSLWYDDRDIAFLRQDADEEAKILKTEASSVQVLINAGYEPDAVIAAVTSGDLRKLQGKHSGLSSVQLQPPATEETGSGDEDEAA